MERKELSQEELANRLVEFVGQDGASGQILKLATEMARAIQGAAPWSPSEHDWQLREGMQFLREARDALNPSGTGLMKRNVIWTRPNEMFPAEVKKEQVVEEEAICGTMSEYLDRPWARCPLFERLVVDALIYKEVSGTTSFYRENGVVPQSKVAHSQVLGMKVIGAVGSWFAVGHATNAYVGVVAGAAMWMLVAIATDGPKKGFDLAGYSTLQLLRMQAFYRSISADRLSAQWLWERAGALADQGVVWPWVLPRLLEHMVRGQKAEQG